MPKRPSLTCNQLLFLNEYMANGRNAVQAYRKIHPRSSYNAAHVEASRTLHKPTVQAELAARIQYHGGITREMVETTLMGALEQSKQKNDHVATASIAMDCAKLGGFLVHQTKDLTPKDVEPSDAVRELRRILEPQLN